MAKRLQEYVKYTIKELESYTKQEGSCVRKVNSKLHVSLGPYCLADFKHALSAHIMRRKVGYYDASLEGIVLDIKNIKVLGSAGALRSDDPRIHVDVNADCYVFRPASGAILNGVVKHVGNHHIGVIIYRVFNVSIRFAGKINKEEFKMDDTLQFRIKKFNLQNVFPYIEGDLVTASGHKLMDKFIKVEPESADSNMDSGIEERENHELDELVTLIKEECVSEGEVSSRSKKINEKTPIAKRQQKASASGVSFSATLPIKKELRSAEKKKHKNSVKEELNSSQTKKRKTTSEVSYIENLPIKTEPTDSEKKKRKNSGNEELNSSQTEKHAEKAISKSKKHKVTSEALIATQIKAEVEEQPLTSPTKKRKSLNR
ncbi:PREDICTED: DNA-directed RNA polymerase I subunit RPA43 [Rhagoletis zephyria]|uniref:DNA-directed RNA polymerase I subunit RPA43 n=1 Tax=Rhagoletis zephyria TaxID=28612 RepID=UPI0008118EBE|nr:PREDICTED: DNA-directed RNA polymerase I subunit RPA43 [Rhagoletis zephyria]